MIIFRNVNSFQLAALVVGFAGVTTSATVRAATIPTDVVSVDINGITTSAMGAVVQTPTYTGPAAATGAGTFFNGYQFSSGTQIGLLASDGLTPTTVTFAESGGNSAFYNPTYIANALQNDGTAVVGTSSAPVTFTIGGLVPGQNYSLYLYGVSVAAGEGFSRPTTFTVGGTSMTTNGAGGTDQSGNGVFVAGQDYELFTNLTPGLDGLITGTVTLGPNSTTEADFNGFQLVAVPEPATAGLVALSSLGMLARRRRAGR